MLRQHHLRVQVSAQKTDDLNIQIKKEEHHVKTIHYTPD